MKHSSSVTLAEFLAAGHRPRPSEAVALVLELSASIRPGATAAVSPAIAAGTIVLDAAGNVTASAGQMVEDDQTTSLLGHLLARLLELAGENGVKVPARLRKLSLRAARALPGTRERLTVRAFSSALRRFAPRDTAGAIRQMVERWQREDAGLVGQAPVSEIGRWRRAWPTLWRGNLPARWRALPVRRRKVVPLDSAF